MVTYFRTPTAARWIPHQITGNHPQKTLMHLMLHNGQPGYPEATGMS